MTLRICKAIGCCNQAEPNEDFCVTCKNKDIAESLSDKYPDHYRQVGDVTEVDVFAVNQMFNVQDSSGCLQHAVMKLLLASNSSNTYTDIRQARDALTRWLQLNQEKGNQA